MVSTSVMFFFLLRKRVGICFCVLPSTVLFFQVEPHGLHVARLSYRFLLLKPEKFSKLWDWSCFLEPLKKPCESDLIWCRFHILKVVFKLASRAIESSNLEAQEASACLLRSVLYNSFCFDVVLKMQCMFNDNLQLALFSWEEFCGDTTLERAGWLVEPTADYMSDSPNRNMDFNQENCLNSLRCNYHPVGSPKVHELQPPFRTKRAVTRYTLFYSIFWSFSALCNFIR